MESDESSHQSGNETVVFKSHTHRAEMIPVRWQAPLQG